MRLNAKWPIVAMGFFLGLEPWLVMKSLGLFHVLEELIARPTFETLFALQQ